MQITIIGTGYVGLVTGACFAEMGHSVLCLDTDCAKIANLQKGILPIFEPGLEELIKRNQASHRLAFTTDYSQGIQFGTACFIAVPTPSLEDGSCNIGFIESVVREIAQHMSDYRLIVNKSTVPVGTAFHIEQLVKKELEKLEKPLSFDVASNPEFLKEGSAIQDCLKPDRIVIGANSAQARSILEQIYSAFVFNRDKILMMDILSAEMTKYAANAMLATRISFMNEIAAICQKLGANVNEVRKGIGSDTRIGYSFLYPGVGYGGSCFPKDIRALLAMGRKEGIKLSLLESVEEVNERQKRMLAKKVIEYFARRGGLQDKTIAVWGLSFKPDTDDMREAPSLYLIEELLAKGARLQLFDPVAMPNAQKLLQGTKNVQWCADEFEAAEGADAIALLTEWKQFRHLDLSHVLQKMRNPAFFDGRNQYKPLEMREKGFDYNAFGIPDSLTN